MNHVPYGQFGLVSDPAQLLLDLVLQQIRASASEQEERAFLIAVGRDLARHHPLGESEDLAMFEERINDVWHRLDLGVATITLGEDAIRIRHDSPHDAAQPLARRGPRTLAALLEGAYDAWFRASGSGPKLVTTQISCAAQAIEFRHGA